jgi:ubiquinone/menaquinone biosynthesis C-methylase UbiE
VIKKANRAYYDEFAASYEDQRHDGYHALIDRLEIDLVRRYAAGQKVLEAGCGTGLLLRAVEGVAKLAVGVDLSPGMLDVARNRGLKVAHASVTDLPFSDGDFDLAYSFKVLAHVERIERALSEMARVVRPGGHVVAEFYNPWSLRYLVKRMKRPTTIAEDTHDEHVYTRYDSLSAIRRHLPPSLSIVAVRGVRVVTPFSQVHRVPILRRAFELMEWTACDAPVLKHFGGFLAIVARKR